MDLATALAPLETGYAEALTAVATALEPDDRVRALWVAGSVGRGTADAGSDLDLIVTVRPGESPDLPWGRLLDPILTFPIPGLPGGVAITTRAGLRVDVVVETTADLVHTPYRHRIAVLDRDGSTVPEPPPEAGPDLVAMTAVLDETLRQAAIFPAAVVAREDWLLGQVAVHNYAVLLYRLLAAANEPLPPMGVKQWSRRLTTHQRALLAALPQPPATREDVVAAMQEVRDAVLVHGRSAYESAGGTWPDEIVAALAGYWRRHGLDWPAPR